MFLKTPSGKSRFILISLMLFIIHPIYAQGKGDEVGNQQDSVITTGSYIRITAPTRAVKWTSRGRPLPIKGILKAIYADVIILEGNDFAGQLSIPLSDIEKLEMPRGKARLQNILIGGGIGLLGGTAIAILIARDDLKSASDERIARGMIKVYAGAGIGLTAGLIVGNIFPPYDCWKEVPLNRIKIALYSKRDRGFGMEIAFAF